MQKIQESQECKEQLSGFSPEFIYGSGFSDGLKKKADRKACLTTASTIIGLPEYQKGFADGYNSKI